MSLYRYKTADGKQVPGVTTVISRFKDSGGLIHWAWNLGMEGKDYRDVRDSAADAGTLAHKMVQLHVIGGNYEDALRGYENDVIEPALAAFGAYRTWEAQSKLQILHTEVPMVSERHRFGGRLDAIGFVEGKRSLVDWKTANSTYPDHLIQMAAYKELWEENHPDEPIEGGYQLCRFARNQGDFSHHYFADLSEGWELFLLYRQAYELDKSLKKRV